MTPLIDLIDKDVMEALCLLPRMSLEETNKLRDAIPEQIWSLASSLGPERIDWMAAQNGPRQLWMPSSIGHFVVRWTRSRTTWTV